MDKDREQRLLRHLDTQYIDKQKLIEAIEASMVECFIETTEFEAMFSIDYRKERTFVIDAHKLLEILKGI